MIRSLSLRSFPAPDTTRRPAGQGNRYDTSRVCPSVASAKQIFATQESYSAAKTDSTRMPAALGRRLTPQASSLPCAGIARGFNALQGHFIALRSRRKAVDQLGGLVEEGRVFLADRFQDVRELCQKEKAFAVAIYK